MKTTTIALALCLLTSQVALYSQSAIQISPNHTKSGVAACPDPTINEYTLLNVPPSCGVNISLVEGEAEEFIPDNDNKKFLAAWADIPQKVKVRIAPVQPGCFPITEIEIIVLSITGFGPSFYSNEVSCPGLLVAGKVESFSMLSELFYPFRGQQDPPLANFYEWELQVDSTSQWHINSISPNGNTDQLALLLADLAYPATLRARAKSKCGIWSEWRSCEISRYAMSFCPIKASIDTARCGSTEPVIFFITPSNLLTGYTYHWIFPDGWTGNATGNAILVTPNGLNGGFVKMYATAFGYTSDTCELYIPIEEGCEPLALDENDKNHPPAFRLFPNPALEQITLESNSLPLSYQRKYRILNQYGSEVFAFELPYGKNSFTIPLRDWSPGVYLVQQLIGDRILSTQRFVVLR